MLQYTVSIGGVSVSVSQLNMVLTFDKTLDYGSFVVRNTTATAYDVGAPVDIDVTDGTTTKNYHFVISSDQVTKLPRSKYVHAIDLVELTKILEWQTDSVRTFTQPLGNVEQLTLFDVVTRLQATLPLERVSDLFTTRVFAIDNTLADKLRAVEAPEFVFQNKNLKEMLDEIFDFINAIPRLTKSGSNIVLTADFFNERGSLVTSAEFSRQETFNINGFSTALDADIKNIYDTYTTVIEPAPSTFKRLTAAEGDFREDNAYLKTDYPIVFIESLKCKAQFVIQAGANTSVTTDPIEIDITDYILEEEEWQNLSNKPTVENLSSGAYRDNTLFFTRFKAGVFNLFEEVGSMRGVAVIGGKSRLYAVLTRAAREQNVQATIGAVTFDVYKAEAISPFFEVEFQIEYKAQFSSRTEVKRADTSRIKYESRSYTGQSDNVVRADRVLDRLYKLQQLLGNAEIVTSERVKELDNLHNISDYNDENYVITTVELQFEKLFVIAKYLWSQNFQKVSDFISLNGEIRLFDIPNTTFKRNVYLEDFVEIDTQQATSTGDVLSLGKATFLNTFSNAPTNEANKPVNLFSFDTNSNPTIQTELETIMKPIAKYAGGNSINFYVEFDNPKIAGWQLSTFSSEMEEVINVQDDETDDSSQNFFQQIWSGITGFFQGIGSFFQRTFRSIYKKPINKGIYYADATGQVYDFSYQLFNSVDAVSSSLLPAIAKADRQNALIGNSTYRVYKDIREEFALTYSLQVMAAPGLERTVIVGKYLIERNNLLKEITVANNQFEVFGTNDVYSIHNNKASKDTDTALAVTYSLNATTGLMALSAAVTGYTTWGIRKKGTLELVLAVNQGATPIQALYFNFLDNQSNVIYPSQSTIVVTDVSAVASLSASTPPPTTSTINVVWTDTNTPASESFTLEYSKDLVEWTSVTLQTNTYQITGLDDYTTYSIRVRANQGALFSEWNYVSAKTLGIGPDAPVNLSARLLNERRIMVEWDAVPSADKINIQVSTNSNFVPLITDGSKITNGSSVRIIFDNFNSSITYATTYYIRARSYGNETYGSFGSTVQITTAASPITSAPLITNVRIVEGTGQLRYQVINTDSQIVTLYADLSNGSTIIDAQAFPNEATEIFVNPGSATTIFAKAQAANKLMSEIVEVDFVVTEPPGPVLISPIIVAKGAHRINWFYSTNNPQVDGFAIERDPDGDNASGYDIVSPLLAPDARGYTDTLNLVSGTTYSYRVIAYNAAGGTRSLVEQATAISGVPATPSNLTQNNLQGDPGQFFVELNWQRNSTDENGFLIFRSSGGAYAVVGGTAKAQTTYSETVNGVSGTTYSYYIIAYNEFGNSLASNIVSVTAN